MPARRQRVGTYDRVQHPETGGNRRIMRMIFISPVQNRYGTAINFLSPPTESVGPSVVQFNRFE